MYSLPSSLSHLASRWWTASFWVPHIHLIPNPFQFCPSFFPNICSCWLNATFIGLVFLFNFLWSSASYVFDISFWCFCSSLIFIFYTFANIYFWYFCKPSFKIFFCFVHAIFHLPFRLFSHCTYPILNLTFSRTLLLCFLCFLLNWCLFFQCSLSHAVLIHSFCETAM